MQRPWGESGRPVWLELRRKAELERWNRVKVGVGGTLGALGSPESFCARDANMIGVRRIFLSADMHAEPYCQIGKIRLLSKFPSPVGHSRGRRGNPGSLEASLGRQEALDLVFAPTFGTHPQGGGSGGGRLWREEFVFQSHCQDPPPGSLGPQKPVPGPASTPFHPPPLPPWDLLPRC